MVEGGDKTQSSDPIWRVRRGSIADLEGAAGRQGERSIFPALHHQHAYLSLPKESVCDLLLVVSPSEWLQVSATLLVPEGLPFSYRGCDRLGILLEDLQALWKSRYGLRGPSQSLRNHAKQAASCCTCGPSQPGVWALLGGISKQTRGMSIQPLCLDLSAWCSTGLCPSPVLTC